MVPKAIALFPEDFKFDTPIEQLPPPWSCQIHHLCDWFVCECLDSDLAFNLWLTQTRCLTSECVYFSFQFLVCLFPYQSLGFVCERSSACENMCLCASFCFHIFNSSLFFLTEFERYKWFWYPCIPQPFVYSLDASCVVLYHHILKYFCKFCKLSL